MDSVKVTLYLTEYRDPQGLSWQTVEPGSRPALRLSAWLLLGLRVRGRPASMVDETSASRVPPREYRKCALR